MTPPPTDIIELVRELNERKPKGWQWGDEVAQHFDTITEALLIAVGALEALDEKSYWHCSQCECDCSDDDIASGALFKIRTLPLK